MIHVLELLDDGCLGKKGELVYFVENENGFINTTLSFLWNDCGRIGKAVYSWIWNIVTKTSELFSKTKSVYHRELGF